MAVYDDAAAYNDTLNYDDVDTPYYGVVVVDRTGTVLATLDDVSRIGAIRQTLNAPSTGALTLHNMDPDAAAIVALEREVQFKRNGEIYDWMVPTRPESNLDAETDEVTVSCQGLLWYFDRRYFGRADRANKLINPEFEGSPDLTGWTNTGGATATADTTTKITGTKSAKLVGSAAGVDRHLGQAVSITSGTVGELLTVVGWFYIDPAGWLGPAVDSRGLFIERRVGSTVQEFDFALIDDDTPRGAWQRAEVTVHMPASVTETVEVRLYSPGGTIYWDAASLTLMESLSSYATDQATIAARIVEHAQDTTYTKSNLNIATDCPATGVLRDRHYQFAEHQNIGAALAEFPALDNGFDYDIALGPSSRVFTTYYPRRGTARSAVALSELSRARWLFDGENASSSVTLLADGDGPDREEGGAVDSSVFGGVILETVEAAPTGTPIDALDARANEKLRVAKNPRVLETTFGPGLRVGALFPGDTATVTIDHGFMQVSGSWRVIATTLDPASDQLTAEWNPA